MSVATEISRIQANKGTIRAKLVELGLATNTDNLDKLAAAIESIVNKGAISVTVREGETVSIPAGYHNGSGTVTAISDTEGDAEKYKLQSKSVIPTKKQQSITPETGYYGLSDVTVAPIPDAYQDVTAVTAAAGDVLTGKIFVTATGAIVAGTMANNGAVARTLDVTTISFTIPNGYHSGTGTVKIVLEEKTVTPTKAKQTITPTTGKVLSKVTVDPIPDNYIDTSDADALAGEVLDGKFVYVDGEKIEGSMPNNGDTSKTIDGLTSTSVSIPAGYTAGGTVSLTGDIEEALAAI